MVTLTAGSGVGQRAKVLRSAGGYCADAALVTQAQCVASAQVLPCRGAREGRAAQQAVRRLGKGTADHVRLCSRDLYLQQRLLQHSTAGHARMACRVGAPRSTRGCCRGPTRVTWSRSRGRSHVV